MLMKLTKERIETEEAYQKLLRTPAKSILMFDAIKEDKKTVVSPHFTGANFAQIL